jgi:hypothetical protein
MSYIHCEPRPRVIEYTSERPRREIWRERNREKETGVGGENVSVREKAKRTERWRENGRDTQGGGKSRADRRIWFGIYVRGEKEQTKKKRKRPKKGQTKHEDVRNTHKSK